MKVVNIPTASCPYTATGNAFIVDFSGTKLISNGNATEKTFNLGRTVSSGKFKISLHASDGYESRVNADQPNERYKVVFQNNGNAV
jgi:hypothetical protein